MQFKLNQITQKIVQKNIASTLWFGAQLQALSFGLYIPCSGIWKANHCYIVYCTTFTPQIKGMPECIHPKLLWLSSVKNIISTGNIVYIYHGQSCFSDMCTLALGPNSLSSSVYIHQVKHTMKAEAGSTNDYQESLYRIDSKLLSYSFT